MRKHLYFLYLLLLATACEYPITENYIEISKPEPEITAFMDLNAIVDGNAILITQSTQLDFSLSLPGKEVNLIIFSLGDQTWQNNSANGNIYIEKDYFPPGEYILKAQFYAATGSGSIAEQVGAEAYQGEMSWPVVIDYSLHTPNVLNYRKNSSGSFELYWQAPHLNHLQLKSYRVDVGIYETHSTTIPANQTYFVDNKQVGNATAYRVYANFRYEDKKDITWYVGSLELPDQNKLYIAKWDMKNIYLRWELPYACLVRFSMNDGTPFAPSVGDEYLTVPVSCFGSMAWWDLNKVEMQLSLPDQPSEIVYRKTINVGSPGEYFDKERGSSWCYNPLTQSLYAADLGVLNVYKYPETTSLQTLRTNDYYEIISSRTEPLIALYASNQKIEIRDARSLALLHTINEPYLNIESRKKEQHLLFTPDNKLMYRKWHGSSMQVVTCELDGTIISTCDVKNNPSLISHDGNYIIHPDNIGMKVIELKNHQPVNEYILPIPYESQSYMNFNPIKSSQLIVPDRANNCIEIRGCKDYELIRKIPLTGNTEFISADPITGNILVNNSNILSVLSATNGNELLSLKAAQSIFPVLIGNHLISYDGYMINIEKTISK